MKTPDMIEEIVLSKIAYEIMEALINDHETQKKFQQYMDLSLQTAHKAVAQTIDKVMEILKDHVLHEYFGGYTQEVYDIMEIFKQKIAQLKDGEHGKS